MLQLTPPLLTLPSWTLLLVMLPLLRNTTTTEMSSSVALFQQDTERFKRAIAFHLNCLAGTTSSMLGLPFTDIDIASRWTTWFSLLCRCLGKLELYGDHTRTHIPERRRTQLAEGKVVVVSFHIPLRLLKIHCCIFCWKADQQQTLDNFVPVNKVLPY